MTTQIFFDRRNAVEPAPITDGPYGELLEEMRLGARELIELLARERAGTFDGVGASFWIGRDRLLDKARKLFELAETRAASLKDGSFRR
jgi:hypothetical protein